MRFRLRHAGLSKQRFGVLVVQKVAATDGSAACRAALLPNLYSVRLSLEGEIE